MTLPKDRDSESKRHPERSRHQHPLQDHRSLRHRVMNEQNSNDGKNARTCDQQWKSPGRNAGPDPGEIQKPGRK
jgi:hypothetical protein